MPDVPVLAALPLVDSQSALDGAVVVVSELNSEVSLLGSVAVAVIILPKGSAKFKATLKLTLPLPSVVTVVDPR